MEDMLDLISNGKLRWQKPCDNCREQLNLSINKITNDSNLHYKNLNSSDNSVGFSDKNQKDIVKTKKVSKRGIEIDEFHTLIVAKYGLVVKYEKEGNVTLKRLKRILI